MGQVVPFIARVRDCGDWTASERARLEELAGRLSGVGVDVEVIFGATDEGDPWCVVTDADGDVLIHVARIDGVFVVHSAVDDAMSEGVDLHAVLRSRLAATEDAMAPKAATILPFEARQAQTLLALVVAAAFFYETAGLGGEAQAAEPLPPPAPEYPPPPPAAAEADTQIQDREVIARAAAVHADEAAPAVAMLERQTPAATPVEASAPPPQRLESAAADPAPQAPAAVAQEPEAPVPVVIEGTADDDRLVGTAASERILGGAGNDTLSGGGGHDTLDGGAGDDRIELSAEVVAIGGAGADAFVIGGRGHGPDADFFGVILDFDALQGDRVVNGQGGTVGLTPHPPGGRGGGESHDFSTTTLGQTPLTRVDVDLDNDGIKDGYLVVGRPPAPPPAPVHHDDPPIAVTGQSLAFDTLG